jgi:hypothetical protein
MAKKIRSKHKDQRTMTLRKLCRAGKMKCACCSALATNPHTDGRCYCDAHHPAYDTLTISPLPQAPKPRAKDWDDYGQHKTRSNAVVYV